MQEYTSKENSIAINIKSKFKASVVVCALYHFVHLDDYEKLRQPLLEVMIRNNVKGTLLLALEGVNGTIAGSREGIDQVLSWLKSDPRLIDLDHKESYDSEPPFFRSKVKLKKEIVTMGVEGIDPNRLVGTHVKPTEWNALIADPEVLLVDTRNDYEVEIGTFKNAVNPQTETFREFPDFVRDQLATKKHKKIAMFCTGGIRCEKSTAYLKEQGFDKVYHLEGGILKYLEEVPESDSLWQGECFVFDNRVAVNHALEKGSYDQCHACRLPLTVADKQDNKYQKGISCHRCFDNKTAAQKRNYEEREKQMQLATERGEKHLGSEAADTIKHRKLEKAAEKNEQKNTIEKCG